MIRKHLFRVTILLFFALSLLAQAPQPAPVKVDSDTVAGIGARNIGPAIMSGRISALDAVYEKDRLTIFCGAASGGLWRSKNGGTTWKPVFDKYNQSIGALRIAPTDPQIIWLGTGESWVRNSVSIGDGVYRSTDGGDTWINLGLSASERISAIEVDPRNPEVAYVAAQGPLWSSGGERGVYKTRDGGKTWERILFVDKNTGAASLAMDLKNPDVIYAGMWQHRRLPWTFESGGPGSGFYKSSDGGKTWTKLNGDPKRGLPDGILGRIAVAIAPSDSKVVYAAVEAKDGALYRSDNSGETWTRQSDSVDVMLRPFYFSFLAVDPKDPLRVYKPALFLNASSDGGHSFTIVGYSAHADFHPMWIDPINPERMMVGTDGGLYVSEDRGNSWRMVPNLPLAQFYHVSVDEAQPYNVMGGLQDNSTWRGPSKAGGGIANRHWSNLFGGDGFWAWADPTDADYVYVEYQGGEMARKNVKTGGSRSIKPQEGPGESRYRWNWNTPIMPSPVEKGTIFVGCQYLFCSRDNGNSWERISIDLTTNNPAKISNEKSGGLTSDNSSAEMHCTIYSIAPSPKNAKLIWVGTDDGNVQLTKDGGKTWKNLAGKITGLPSRTWVSWIEASPYAEGTAFATFDGHTNGDMKPYIYRTDDFGQTWKPLITPELEGFAHVVKQDPLNPELLYLGTELGLFLSLDGGQAWIRFSAGDFPRVPVRDLAFQTREHDLVIATHGRGIWIVDDLTPLRALKKDVLEKDVALLPSRPQQRLGLPFEGWCEGDQAYVARNAPDGINIAYYLKKRLLIGDLKLEVLDENSQVLDTPPVSKRRGINRVYWSGELKGPKVAKGSTPAFSAFGGPMVPEGTYKIRLTKGKEVLESQVQILADPRSPFTREDRVACFETVKEVAKMLEDMAYTVDRIADLQDQAKQRGNEIKVDAQKAKFVKFVKALETNRALFVPVREEGGITGEERLRDYLASLYGSINGFEGRPSKTNLDRKEALRKDIQKATDDAELRIKKDLVELNAILEKAGMKALLPMERSTWNDKQKK
ncbi:MAG: hypothetical protein L6428_03525 [Candidatus Aminicenantes bacterium]|nr:hypothetical protein [Acidobacteriota bacterium]MCG2810515.1 hypothetical protein [Candidatus Aminicenantes bacterium]